MITVTIKVAKRDRLGDSMPSNWVTRSIAVGDHQWGHGRDRSKMHSLKIVHSVAQAAMQLIEPVLHEAGSVGPLFCAGRVLVGVGRAAAIADHRVQPAIAIII